MRKKWNKRVLAAVMAAAMILGTSTTAFANASPPEGQEAAQEQSASAGENGQTENVRQMQQLRHLRQNRCWEKTGPEARHLPLPGTHRCRMILQKMEVRSS